MNKLKIYTCLILIALISACTNGENNKKEIDKNNKSEEKNITKKKTILVFGDSLTAGLGVEPEEAFPALLGNKIDSLELDYEVINGGLSGETSAAGKARIDWLLKDKVDIFVLELGANDGLRGIPVLETRKNLQSIIDQVKAKYPDAKFVMVAMEVPPNMGKTYASEFRTIFPHLAKKNDMALVPFLLDRVGGVPELNQADGIHPNVDAQPIIRDLILPLLQKM